MNDPKKVLYIDIETATKFKDISELEKKDKKGYELLKIKYNKSNLDIPLHSYYKERGTLYPTFGKIVCLTLGYYSNDDLILKSFTGEEKSILIESHTGFINASKGLYSLCGYYIKHFDNPWIVTKMLKYHIKIPKILVPFDKKPWEVPVFDLHEEMNAKNWSLGEVAYELGVDIPIYDGGEVDKMYHDRNIQDVVIHCESDVKSTAAIYKVIYDNFNIK